MGPCGRKHPSVLVAGPDSVKWLEMASPALLEVRRSNHMSHTATSYRRTVGDTLSCHYIMLLAQLGHPLPLRYNLPT